MIRQACTLILKACGWTLKTEVPDSIGSFVMIGAPHTSNYDFFPAMAVSYLMKRNAHFVIKQEWLRFPLNLIFKPIGAIGLDRSVLKGKSVNTTDLMAGFFEGKKDFVLMISPEGTRSPVSTWKTGFYYIAMKAQVPIVLGYVDYKKKETGLGPIIYPEDFEKDMQKIMDFYRHKCGYSPDKFLLDSRYDVK